MAAEDFNSLLVLTTAGHKKAADLLSAAFRDCPVVVLDASGRDPNLLWIINAGGTGHRNLSNYDPNDWNLI